MSAKIAQQRRENIRMACRANEVEASMNPQVCFLFSLWLLLLAHVSFMLVVNELNNWEPGVAVVDIVSKSGGVNDREFDLELTFLELSLNDLDFSQFIQLLIVTSTVVFRR
jgi:hypothetical protein